MTHEQDLVALARSIIDSNRYMTLGAARRERTSMGVTRAVRLGGVSGRRLECAPHVGQTPSSSPTSATSSSASPTSSTHRLDRSGLHTFYLVTMALMLTWYLRYARHAKSGCTGRPTPREHDEMAGSPDSPVPAALWPAAAGVGNGHQPDAAPSATTFTPPTTTNRLEPQG